MTQKQLNSKTASRCREPDGRGDPTLSGSCRRFQHTLGPHDTVQLRHSGRLGRPPPNPHTSRSIRGKRPSSKPHILRETQTDCRPVWTTVSPLPPFNNSGIWGYHPAGKDTFQGRQHNGSPVEEGVQIYSVGTLGKQGAQDEVDFHPGTEFVNNQRNRVPSLKVRASLPGGLGVAGQRWQQCVGWSRNL